MCGIAGLFDPAGRTPADRLAGQVAAMVDVLAHRGPDADGRWVDAGAGVALGHRRLAVVGLGPEGAQPMVSADGRWVVAYNGELYNVGDLRPRLEAEGYAFGGHSDTEVVAASVQQWGLDVAVEAWEGMFAVAVWDRRLRRLHLLRDRFGEKPLYYGWVAGRLAFASELKALRLLDGFRGELDRRALAQFLRYSCIPAPATVYAGVAKLGPAQMVTVDPGAAPGRLPIPRRYWSALDLVDRATADRLDGTPDELAEETERVLSSAVAARMEADVPVGAFLSGGIDSSLVVSLMQRHATVPVRTFTVGFAERAFDESPEAEAVAAHLGTDHTTLRVDDADAMAVIPDLPDVWDEPFADVSQLPTVLVSRLARTRVTVALTGDAGDELFAGYNRHAWLERLWATAAPLPPAVRRGLGATVARVPPGLVDGAAATARAVTRRPGARNPSTKAVKVGKVLAADGPADAYTALVSHWDRPGSVVLGLDGDGRGERAAADAPDLDTVTERLLWLDLTGYLPDDILTKVDRAAMSASLETRVPFLDRGVVELAWRLPLAAKLGNGAPGNGKPGEGQTKWVLRRVLDRYVPRELVERPKMGFGLPIGAWLRGALRPWAEDLLDETRLRAQGLLDPAPVRQAWDRHLSGRRDLGYELWDVLMLQAWLDRTGAG